MLSNKNLLIITIVGICVCDWVQGKENDCTKTRSDAKYTLKFFGLVICFQPSLPDSVNSVIERVMIAFQKVLDCCSKKLQELNKNLDIKNKHAQIKELRRINHQLESAVQMTIQGLESLSKFIGHNSLWVDKLLEFIDNVLAIPKQIICKICDCDTKPTESINHFTTTSTEMTPSMTTTSPGRTPTSSSTTPLSANPLSTTSLKPTILKPTSTKPTSTRPTITIPFPNIFDELTQTSDTTAKMPNTKDDKIKREHNATEQVNTHNISIQHNMHTINDSAGKNVWPAKVLFVLDSNMTETPSIIKQRSFRLEGDTKQIKKTKAATENSLEPMEELQQWSRILEKISGSNNNSGTENRRSMRGKNSYLINNKAQMKKENGTDEENVLLNQITLNLYKTCHRKVFICKFCDCNDYSGSSEDTTEKERNFFSNGAITFSNFLRFQTNSNCESIKELVRKYCFRNRSD